MLVDTDTRMVLTCIMLGIPDVILGDFCSWLVSGVLFIHIRYFRSNSCWSLWFQGRKITSKQREKVVETLNCEFSHNVTVEHFNMKVFWNSTRTADKVHNTTFFFHINIRGLTRMLLFLSQSMYTFHNLCRVCTRYEIIYPAASCFILWEKKHFMHLLPAGATHEIEY